jgi:hypothetical protein
MWQSFPWIDRARARRLILATSVAGLILTGCGPVGGKVYQLDQPIQMGPWTFAVTGAKERTENRGRDRYKTIVIVVELENYMERHEKPFDDFLNGSTQNSMMSHPKMWLVSEAGKKFDGDVRPESGGSMRSRRWQAEFLLAEFSLRENTSDTAKRYLDKHPADFRLVIQNPDRRKGQPREVTIQLP